MQDFARRSRRRSLKTSRIFVANKVTRNIFIGLIGFVIVSIIVVLWYSRDLPTPGKLSSMNLSQSTRILDRNGIVLYDIYTDQNRTYVQLPKISRYLKEGTIAIEDKDFYKNDGFSIAGYLRTVRNLLLFQGVTGGSTLTQQLVKNALLTSERSIPRKIKEFILAIEVDRKYSKDQILELYLNVAPYGGPNVGVETAAESYFGKKAQDLTLVESAILAGMPQRPSYFLPYGTHPKAYIARTEDVLRRMREDGYISKQQEENAVKELPKVRFLSQTQSIKAPHFSFYVKDLLIKQFGESMVESGGLQVTTTLDYKLEEKAETIVKEEVDNAKGLKVGNGASIVLDPRNGEILAMVGSKDFFATDSSGKTTGFEGQFNVITQGKRQPGSSIKPVAYATALAKGYTAATLLMDTKTLFPGQGGKDYIPVNYDGKYHGPVQVRFALGNSLNIPAVKMLALIGVRNMLQTAYDMGISGFAPTQENTSRFGLSLTLGGGEVIPLEFATSYSVFANGGYKVEPVSILKVTDKKGNILYEHKDSSSKKQVLKPEITFIISHMLLDNNARLLTFGSYSLLNIGSRQVAVKTGTTDDKRDNWAIGWTPNILVAAWVGNNDNSPMGSIASGITGASPIWRRIVLEVIKDRPNQDFQKPNDVIATTVDSLTGGLPVDGKSTRSEYFVKGTEPQSMSPVYINWDNKYFIQFKEKDPVSVDGQNRWQQGIDDWVNQNYKDDPLYHPPEDALKPKQNSDLGSNSTPILTPTFGSATPTLAETPTPTPTPTESP
ncbi:MAG: penicillin-binding protein [Candidatus Levybacteria bacterium CG_4_9_14_3_um_filter_35_16]|nr:MAG: penicillin-binding protein [Candidatus Levybacteria bacterium CG_4_9_14_3_um_filter_35_16]PJC54412.1 MAG: penicillin-binding protein [Candidatus Levybacteria bacterium CG_4_9_14_0_2_um_filter_35_21]